MRFRRFAHVNSQRSLRHFESTWCGDTLSVRPLLYPSPCSNNSDGRVLLKLKNRIRLIRRLFYGVERRFLQDKFQGGWSTFDIRPGNDRMQMIEYEYSHPLPLGLPSSIGNIRSVSMIKCYENMDTLSSKLKTCSLTSRCHRNLLIQNQCRHKYTNVAVWTVSTKRCWYTNIRVGPAPNTTTVTPATGNIVPQSLNLRGTQ